MGIVWFIVILGGIVLVHEFGHFIFSKIFGVYVYEFSIGMGPKIFHFKRKNKETEYCIRLIPIGGFVSLAGEDADDNKKIPENRKLYSKPVWQRLLIMVAGVMNNFIFAFLLLFIMAFIYGSVDTTPLIGDVTEGYPAYTAGLKKGDTILKIDNNKVSNFSEIQLYLQTSEGKEMQFTVLGVDGKERVIKITPDKVETDDGKENYVIGVSLDSTILNEGLKSILSSKKGIFKKLSLSSKQILPSLSYAGKTTISLYKTMFLTIKQLFTGRASVKDLSGPVGIYTIVSSEAKEGLQNILYLTAYLSINVGFINLLPFPAFDGGRVVFLIIEKIRKKRAPVKVEAIVNGVGFILLLLLMAFVTFNDILRII